MHIFAVVTAVATFFLLIAGGLVTSTDSGLAVPDWPLSYGTWFPPMVGGIRYEHGHRMIAAAVGLMIVGLAVWLRRVEPRRWVRRLGYVAVGAVILQGLRQIPADPPHKAVVTKWGKRQTILIDKGGEKREVSLVKDEGWRFFPIYPYWYGYIKVNVAKKNPDFEFQIVMTPDMGSIKIPPSITYIPDPENLIEYLNSGGEEGVDDILGDIVSQKLREWAIAEEEGPQTWEEVMKARDEAILLLAKAILGEELPQICKAPNVPSQVPTTFWFKYFYGRYFDRDPHQGPDEDSKDFSIRREEWGKWKNVIKEEIKEAGEDFIRKQIDDRQKEIKRVRQGNGNKKIKHLGIILARLNLGEFKPQGKLAEAAELRAKERREMMAEKFELEHVKQRVEEFKAVGFSAEQALEIIQTERAKAQKQVQEKKISISPETRLMIKEIMPEIAKSVLGGD